MKALITLKLAKIMKELKIVINEIGEAVVAMKAMVAMATHEGMAVSVGWWK